MCLLGEATPRPSARDQLHQMASKQSCCNTYIGKTMQLAHKGGKHCDTAHALMLAMGGLHRPCCSIALHSNNHSTPSFSLKDRPDS